ncbi:hypothetical protein EV44_g3498 [Erysiphe necator]|uniref:CCHC-type domain-containing protein n=1 Tax=Uncinula necator TaxID=52586 RepID=A0A0B1P689_UNCNE|nr:hypothetical protein EV44_g3498 [Erysiphe necator]
MVGKNNLELESIINKVVASQQVFETRIAESEKKTNKRLEIIEKKKETAEKQNDKQFRDIMAAISALKPIQETENDKGKGKAREEFIPPTVEFQPVVKKPSNLILPQLTLQSKIEGSSGQIFAPKTELQKNSNSVGILQPQNPAKRRQIANADVFKKLSNIQNALQIALIPYHLWAQRVAIEMSGDFSSVRIWSAGKRLSWILFLEGIFTTMQRLNVLDSPFTTFSLLTPKDTESAHAFAWRLRDTFYNLSGIDRQSDTTRDLLKEILMTHLPRVWTISSPQLINSDNHEIVELIVQVASQVAKWRIEDKLLNETNQTENLFNPPSLETPSFNSNENPKISQALSTVFPSTEDICYTCGRKGHWSKNCHTSSTFTPKNAQSQKKSIIKPNNKYGELRRKLNLFRSQKKPSPSYKRKQHQTYLTNNDDITINDEDIDPKTKLDDTSLEQDLDQLLEELELNEDNE